jgi:DNA-directed RNA polymerase specialized sigma24 family protein
MLLDQPDKTVGIDFAAIDIARILTFCRPSDRHLLEQSMSGVTTAEIAREQGASDTAIRIRLLRARRDARLRVEKQKFGPRQSSNTFVMAWQNAA